VVAVELAPAGIQALQVLTVVVFAPLVSGAIAHLEAFPSCSSETAIPGASEHERPRC
jgi:hypothetical protein